MFNVITRILQRWSENKASAPSESRAGLRVGIPKALNVWSTHQFWIGFLTTLGIAPRHITFSSDTSEEQARMYAKGRGTVDCCYPVKAISGHYGELLALDGKRKLDILLSPMIASLPSYLGDAAVDSLTCPRVMAAAENIRAGFTKESDAFAERGIRYASPYVSLGEPALVPRQLHHALEPVLPGLTLDETQSAVDAGFEALDSFYRPARERSRAILEDCAREGRPCIMVLARPYHMDPGIGHEIEVDLQAGGYPILWAQYLPTDDDLLQWAFGREVSAGDIRSPLDISDVWPSSYSANTNEILWGAKLAARLPWVVCAIRLSSYECGMDQPTYSPVQAVIESSGTLFFSFQDLDSTKPAGSVKIRVETISHYLEKQAPTIMARKLERSAPDCPLLIGHETDNRDVAA